MSQEDRTDIQSIFQRVYLPYLSLPVVYIARANFPPIHNIKRASPYYPTS
jgi:hypothetical protein